jgi:hypothetical protein
MFDILMQLIIVAFATLIIFAVFTAFLGNYFQKEKYNNAETILFVLLFIMLIYHFWAIGFFGN